MLEIKNLVKVYRAKGGNDVRAIDDVSVNFSENGMVFLLGKSGSGKSTLLNLCGGLDFPDSGEIVIKGRSSKDFSQADFDSYRNTFVGFVFQEYNILDEFTVEDNIALALELQGKSKDKKAIAEILEKVDLADFAKRKPNTLSGGQKQRIAIARALVKNPEIILADEPTGALDSNTGKQVLDTLKKLSEEKLVIVVSHDREFAEQYGDRIIELKDGKIISDVTKTKIAAVETSDNVSFIGDDTVSVKDGSALTDEDLVRIKDFLSSKKGGAVIASGEKEVSAYKKAAKIDENNSKESFRDTEKSDTKSREYTAEENKLIRSRLPLRHALRIGASGLKVKPFRLFFTVLLSVVAFVMFGLFSTLTFYNAKTTAVSTYQQSGYDYLYSVKNYNYTTTYYTYGKETNSYTSYYMTRFTPDELDAAKEKYGTVYGAYNFSAANYQSNSSIPVVNTKNLSSVYYSTNIGMFVEVNQDSSGFQLLTSTDLGALGKNDVVISSFLFDSLKQAGLYDGYSASSGYVTLNEYGDIVGKTLALNCNGSSNTIPVTVRGVYQAAPPEKYDTIKEGTEPSDSDLSSTHQQLIKSGMYSMVLVSEEFYDEHQIILSGSNYKDMSKYSLSDSLYLNINLDDSYQYQLCYIQHIAPVSEYPIAGEKAVFFTEGKTSLEKNEVLVPFSAISSYLDIYISDLASKRGKEAAKAEYDRQIALIKEKYASLIESYRQEQYDFYLSMGYTPEQAEEYAESSLVPYMETLDPNFYNNIDQASNAASSEIYDSFYNATSIIENGIYYEDGMNFVATETDLKEAFDFMNENCDLSSVSKEVLQLCESSGNIASQTDFVCAGFVYGGSLYSSITYFADDVYTSLFAEYGNTFSGNDPNGEYYYEETSKYKESADAKYNYLVIPFPENDVLTAIVNDENVVADDDSFSCLSSPLSDQLQFANSLIESLETIFLWVGIGMALFSMLLLFNFISVSISNKKKEIGILRAVGARSVDVFKIFYSESSIITTICYVLAMAACFVICPLLNNQVAASLGAAIFSFGPVSWLIMLGIALVTSVIATFLPVYSISRKRPVESIRAL